MIYLSLYSISPAALGAARTDMTNWPGGLALMTVQAFCAPFNDMLNVFTLYIVEKFI
jgi:hypothetical protein